MFPEGEVCLTTQEPVKTPEDLNEVKFRVMTNPLLVEAYQAWGATPTPLPWGEVYGALQTGIIQGQENPAFFIESTKMYEVTDVITCLGHNNFTTAVMANKDFFDGLSDDDKEVVSNASDAAFDYILEISERTCSRGIAREDRGSQARHGDQHPDAKRSASRSWRRPARSRRRSSR